MKLLAPLLVALLVLAAPAGAAARDRDHDHMPDRWERQHGLSPTQAGANADPDRDGVDNRNEFREHTDPHQRDSNRNGRADGREDADGDGLSNADEDASGNDPVDADSDDDGVRDGREGAGTVVAFADGVLQIHLAGGGNVTGSVDELTDVSCQTEGRLERGQHGSGGARRGLRRGRHGHGKGSARHGRAAQLDDDPDADDPDGSFDDEDPAVDEDGATDEDDPAEDGEGDDPESEDGFGDDDSSFDEGWGEDGNGGGACLSKRLRRGAHVHAAELDGTSFLTVELVR